MCDEYTVNDDGSKCGKGSGRIDAIEINLGGGGRMSWSQGFWGRT